MKPSFEAAPAALRHSDATPVWLRRYTKFVAASTLFLIFAGAMVTSTGSGLAVPDWPLSYGMVMPPMIGGIFYEHGHRMIAATVGLLTVIQAIWLQLREPKRFARILGWCSVGAVIAQGVLGGVTVLLLLPHSVSIAHAGLAEIFFCLNASIAFFTSNWFRTSRSAREGRRPDRIDVAARRRRVSRRSSSARRCGTSARGWRFLTSRCRSAVSCRTSRASQSPSTSRIASAASGRARWSIYLAVRLRRFESLHPLRQLSNLLVTVVLIQIALGGYVVWSGKQPVITAFM